MTTLTALPAFPVPGRACSLTFGIGASSNFAKIWVVSAPQGSDLRNKIDASTTSRFAFESGEAGSNHPISFTPDKGGVYTFIIQEYQKGAAAFGGAYEGDPSSDQTETAIGPEVQLSLQVGQRITQTVGKSPDSATLTLWVWGNTIKATTLATHGEVSPSLTKPKTTKAGIAVESSDVQTALDALAEQDVVSALGSIQGILSNMRAVINAHMGSSSFHHAADTVNQLPIGLTSSVSPKDLATTLTTILGCLKRHYTNDDGGKTTGLTPGPDSASYHLVGFLKNDIVDLPIFDSVGDLETAYGALADVWRSYTAHRLSSDVHTSVDNTHLLAPLPKVLTLHKAFVSVLSSVAPAIPTTINSGVVTAVSTAGFKES